MNLPEKKTKIQIKSVFGSVPFEHECDNNTIKITLEKAVEAGANLSEADLSEADLSEADLSGANLSWANLSWANLTGANLSGANLSWANLSGANLSGANLSWADLSGANLSEANLTGANLTGANLTGAYLSGANLTDVKNADLSFAQTIIVPDTGAFVGWKKCKYGVIVKLLIPEDAKRSNASGRKCRASKVQVLEVIGAEEGISHYNEEVIYRSGETVECDQWDENRWDECSGGIHFFITKTEAENYDL